MTSLCHHLPARPSARRRSQPGRRADGPAPPGEAPPLAAAGRGGEGRSSPSRPSGGVWHRPAAGPRRGGAQQASRRRSRRPGESWPGRPRLPLEARCDGEPPRPAGGTARKEGGCEAAGRDGWAALGAKSTGREKGHRSLGGSFLPRWEPSAAWRSPRGKSWNYFGRTNTAS